MGEWSLVCGLVRIWGISLPHSDLRASQHPSSSLPSHFPLQDGGSQRQPQCGETGEKLGCVLSEGRACEFYKTDSLAINYL